MSRAVRIAACLVVCATGGCYRTVYRNFEPAEEARAVDPVRRSSAWRSFFLYGWLPSQVVVDAAAECGGVANVREIRTSRSFGQGMVAMIATSGGVNVYSPWTGEVVCAPDGGRGK